MANPSFSEIKEKDGEIEKDVTKDFDLEIKNFGPIKSGKISIKPLTILIGANQSGKSYASMLIYSIYKAQSNIAKDDSLMDSYYNLASDQEKEELSVLFKEFINKDDYISNKTINNIFRITYQKAYEKTFNEEITRSFASPLKELIQIKNGKKQPFIFKFWDAGEKDPTQNTTIIFKNEELKIIQFPNFDIHMKLEIKLHKQDINTRIFNKIKNELKKEYKHELADLKIDQEDGFKKKFGFLPVYFLIINFIRAIISEKYTHCYYLPAARSGILQGHKALFTSIIRLAPYAGEKRMEIPTLSGVISDFINSMVIIPREKGPLYDIARKFENEIIFGEIIVSKQEKFSYPEIGYVYKNVEIPIHRASSTVSELAPIFLYLKYIIKPKDVLIIEEPEAHLHPNNQRILARLIVNLIRNNVRIIITTHSDYLLEQLNNFILLENIDEKTRIERYNLKSEEFLKIDEVSTNLFKYEENKGNVILQLKIDNQTGIPLDEFAKVTKELYKESVKIQRDLNQ